MKKHHSPWRAALLCCLLAMLLCLCACSRDQIICDGIDKMTMKVRAELNLPAETPLEFIVEFADGDDYIFWFASGDDASGRTYHPVEFKHVQDEQYRFIKVHTNIDHAPDIGIVNWHEQYCFLINNAKCAYLDIEENGDGIVLKPDAIPYICNYPAIGDFTYTFFNKNFDEIKH